MRVALLYAPPWKIPLPGTAPDPVDGPPEDFARGHLDGDFFQMPYGMLSLAAQCLRDGVPVKLLNLSAFAWPEVERVIAKLQADVYGLSCFTANRRGTFLLASLIRQRWPHARVVVGGPHVTALATETLQRVSAIDAVVLGEAEHTWRELLASLQEGRGFDNIAGLAYRRDGHPVMGPSRARIHDLDSLECVHRHFPTHLLITARGCPGRCSFCATKTVWGKDYRAHSVPYIVASMEAALEKLPVRMMVIKDETFTANAKRALELCRAIRAKRLRLVWSCDSRADALNEELVREMRLAGCERLSLGVESGSPTVLRNIGKNVMPGQVQAATSLARRYGLRVRYYMMLGNRGETAETFQQSLAFVRTAKPDQYLFSCLSVYPGTADFNELERRGEVSRQMFFDERFQELKMSFDASAEDEQLMGAWFERHAGLQQGYEPTIAHLQQVLERLGDYSGAHMDLAGAYYRDGQWSLAEQHVYRALALDYPLPGLAYNYLAGIARARGDVHEMQQMLERAAQVDPWHAVVLRNVRTVREWARQRLDSHPPPLQARHDFELLERTVQPMLPGPLPEDFANW